ncbi:MAG: (2Fe-2S)-binding protein [Pseudomonadales bacterium]|nr:(2Fe-2S)-binding protein [Pseudomonadales bacterium]
MIVCVCKRVNSAQIREAVERGALDLPAITRELGLGTGCGRCVEFAERMVMQELQLLQAQAEVA